VCNDTKWELLRSSLTTLRPRPSFRIKDLNGHYSLVDDEWDHHFRLDGHATKRYVDIFCSNEKTSDEVLQALRLNHVAGHAIEGGYRVYGYTLDGEQIAKF